MQKSDQKLLCSWQVRLYLQVPGGCITTPESLSHPFRCLLEHVPCTMPGRSALCRTSHCTKYMFMKIVFHLFISVFEGKGLSLFCLTITEYSV